MKKIIPILVLAAGLMGCNTNEPANNQAETSKVEVKSEEGLAEKAAQTESVGETKTNVTTESTEPTETKETADSDQSQVDDKEVDESTSPATEADQNSANNGIKEIVEAQYEKISSYPTEWKLAGETKEVTSDEKKLVEDFGLKFIEGSEIEDPDLYQVTRSYEGPDQGKLTTVVINFSDSATNDMITIKDMEKLLLTLPYGINVSDNYQTAKNKLETFTDFNAYFPRLAYKDTNLVFFAGGYGFNLNYTGGVLDTMDVYQVTDKDIKMNLVMREYSKDLTVDDGGKISIAGHEFSQPIKLGELESILGVEAVDPTIDEIKEFGFEFIEEYPENLQSYKLFKLPEDNVLTYYYNENDIGYVDDDPNAESLKDDVYSVMFKKDVPFTLSNGDINITNENIDTEIEKLKIYNMADADNDAFSYFYLDDNSVVSLDNDLVMIENSTKEIRDNDRIMSRINKEMETDPFIKDLFYDHIVYN